MREGWDRRGARSRLDRRRSFKEMVKRRGAIRMPRPPSRMTTCAFGSSAAQTAGDSRRRVLHAGCVGKHVGSRPQARQDFLLLGRAGPAARIPPLETVFVAHTTEAWEFTEQRVLPGERQRRHRCLYRPYQGARDHRRALQPGPLQHLPLLRLRWRQLTPAMRPQAREALAESRRSRQLFHGYVEVSSRPVSASSPPKPGGCIAELAATGLRRRQLCAERLRRCLGRGAALLRQSQAASECRHA